MRDYEAEKIDREIEKQWNSGKLQGKKIYLFGAGDYSRYIIGIIREKGYDAEAMIDNDASKQGGFCAGCRIIALDEVVDSREQSKVYVICSDFWKEMYKQLRADGIARNQMILIKKNAKTLLGKMKDAYLGCRIYKRLVRHYGDVNFYLCPYTGTGDIYLIGTFWRQFIEKNNIENYVFLVLSKACYRVTQLFEIENVVLLEHMKDAEYLIDYYLLKKSEIPLTLLNDGWRELPYSHTEWLRGYKELYFTKLFRSFVFELPDEVRPIHPVIGEITDEIHSIFQENGLLPGKTFVLSPYSNTLFDLPMEFWKDLISCLSAKGFTLCTNCGNETELPLPGTKRIFVKLDLAPQFVDYAGYFIGVRSGFCDIISGTTAKKAILYYKGNRFYQTSAFCYFNLKDMELCDDALELEYTMETLTELQGRLMEWIG